MRERRRKQKRKRALAFLMASIMIMSCFCGTYSFVSGESYPDEGELFTDMTTDTESEEFVSVSQEPEETLIPEEALVQEEPPIPEEPPVQEEIPVQEESPVQEETPVPEEPPIQEEPPIPEETPVPEEMPVPEETPIPEETPVPEETPIPEETPVPEETPIPEEKLDEEFTEEQQEEFQEGNTLSFRGGDYTVTVSYSKSANLLENAELSVREILPETEEYQIYYQQTLETLPQENVSMGLAFARFFDITFMSDGEEVEPSEPVNVKIAYDESLDVSDKTGTIIHFAESGTELLHPELTGMGTAVDTFEFVQESFSVSGTILANSSYYAEGGTQSEEPSAPVQIQESILTSGMLEANGSDISNRWQVADNGYSGNAGSNKTAYGSDGNVRVQKNVLATDTENEFLVYLSIDTKQVFEEYFQHAAYEATTSNNYHGEPLGTVVNTMTGNERVLVTGESGAGYPNSSLFTIQDHEGNTLAENVRIYWSQAENVTFYLKLSNGKYVLIGVKVKSGENNTVRLSEEAEKYIQEEVTKAAKLNQVTDIMGDYIEFQNIVVCDGTASYDSDNNQIIWIPAVKANPPREETAENHITTVWNLNAAELVYKVRLNVEKEGFLSCANHMNSAVGDPETYAVNSLAKLTYNGDQTVDFPVPYVRGLLYEFKFQKVDSEDSSKGLPGAAFTLTASDGRTYTALDMANGEYCFSHIPWGNYTLTETTPPSGYKTGSVSSWKVSIGYTLDLQDGTSEIDKHIHEADSVYYRWIGAYTGNALEYDPEKVWIITNEKDFGPNIIFKKVSAANTAIVLSGAEFELYDSDRRLLGTMTSGEDGFFRLAEQELDEGVYYLKETKAPTGYQLLAYEIEFTVTEDEENPVSVKDNKALVEKATGEDGQEIYVIKVKNETISELPATGGNGSFRYMIGGILLMAAALILYKNKFREVLKG